MIGYRARARADQAAAVVLQGRFEMLSLYGAFLPVSASPGMTWLAAYLAGVRYRDGSCSRPGFHPIMVTAATFGNATYERLPLDLGAEDGAADPCLCDMAWMRKRASVWALASAQATTRAVQPPTTRQLLPALHVSPISCSKAATTIGGRRAQVTGATGAQEPRVRTSTIRRNAYCMRKQNKMR